MAEIIPSKKIRPNAKRAAIASTMIWAVLTIDLFSIISNYFQYELLQDLNNGIDVMDDQLTANDLRVSLISLLYLIAYIISAVTFIQWFRRAYNNLAARTRINHSEGWAAGGWFVPILCLFRPYQIMKELFEKTDKLIKNKDGLAVKTNQQTLIGVWWALWILVGYIGNYSFKLLFKSDTIENLSNGTVADIVSSVLEIPIGILAIWIIATFAKKESKIQELEAEEQNKVEVLV